MARLVRIGLSIVENKIAILSFAKKDLVLKRI